MLGLYRNTEQVGNVDVNSVVEDTLLLFARQLDRAGVRIDKELEPVPAALGSADQIRQVLSNLVVNAKDSMSQGGVLRVRTHVFHKDDVREMIRIVVADTGSGISETMLNEYVRALRHDQGRARHGIGFVDREGHCREPRRKTARSQPGGQGNGVQHRTSGGAVRKGASMKRKSHILVVDDEPNVLVTYRLILQQQGYEVSAALSSEEARKIAGRGRHRSLALRFVAGEAGKRLRCNRVCAAKESGHADGVVDRLCHARRPMTGLTNSVYRCCSSPSTLSSCCKLFRKC